MPTYTFAFLRDYFSARGLTLSRVTGGYLLTNGRRRETFDSLKKVADAAGRYPHFSDQAVWDY